MKWTPHSGAASTRSGGDNGDNDDDHDGHGGGDDCLDGHGGGDCWWNGHHPFWRCFNHVWKVSSCSSEKLKLSVQVSSPSKVFC